MKYRNAALILKINFFQASSYALSSCRSHFVSFIMQKNILRNKGEFILACFIGLDYFFYVGMETSPLLSYEQFSIELDFDEKFSLYLYLNFSAVKIILNSLKIAPTNLNNHQIPNFSLIKQNFIQQAGISGSTTMFS